MRGRVDNSVACGPRAAGTGYAVEAQRSAGGFKANSEHPSTQI